MPILTQTQKLEKYHFFDTVVGENISSFSWCKLYKKSLQNWCKSFDLIASFIVNDNHRFVTSKISGNSYQRDDAINYLLNSSVVFKANNVQVPSLPLSVRKIEADYKLFYSDIGMMINALGYDVVQGILENKL